MGAGHSWPGGIATGRGDFSGRLGTGSPDHQTPGPRQPTFSFLLGSLTYDRRLRGDPYDPHRPRVLRGGGCGGRSTAPLHRFILGAVRGDELKCRSSIIYADCRFDYTCNTASPQSKIECKLKINSIRATLSIKHRARNGNASVPLPHPSFPVS
jgi:hypothetical protein